MQLFLPSQTITTVGALCTVAWQRENDPSVFVLVESLAFTSFPNALATITDDSSGSQLGVTFSLLGTVGVFAYSFVVDENGNSALAQAPFAAATNAMTVTPISPGGAPPPTITTPTTPTTTSAAVPVSTTTQSSSTSQSSDESHVANTSSSSTTPEIQTSTSSSSTVTIPNRQTPSSAPQTSSSQDPASQASSQVSTSIPESPSGSGSTTISSTPSSQNGSQSASSPTPTSSQPSSTSATKSKLSPKAIAGIVVGGIGFLAIIVACVVFFRRRRKNQANPIHIITSFRSNPQYVPAYNLNLKHIDPSSVITGRNSAQGSRTGLSASGEREREMLDLTGEREMLDLTRTGSEPERIVVNVSRFTGRRDGFNQLPNAGSLPEPVGSIRSQSSKRDTVPVQGPGSSESLERMIEGPSGIQDELFDEPPPYF